MALSRCSAKLPKFWSTQSSAYQALGRTLQFPGEVCDHAPEGGLERIKGRRTDLQALDDAGREGHRRVVGRNEPHQGRSFAAPGFQAGQANGADGEGMKVRDQQLAVAQVDPRCLDGPGHQFRLVVEVVTVVWRRTPSSR